jgi:hypothetical protein
MNVDVARPHWKEDGTKRDRSWAIYICDTLLNACLPHLEGRVTCVRMIDGARDPFPVRAPTSRS